jgi:hypothetical protein
MKDRDRKENTALLEQLNEEIRDRGEATLLQVCTYGYRGRRPNRHSDSWVGLFGIRVFCR